jgi:translocon-associated protein subunit beta
MKSFLSFLLLCVTCFVSADDSARLLAAKNILNEVLVEGKDLTVQYTIFNVGGRFVFAFRI